MKRMLFGLLFGLVVLTGCGGAGQEPPSVVVPQEAASVSSVTEEPTEQPTASPEPAQRKVAVEPTTAPAPVVKDEPEPAPVEPKQKREEVPAKPAEDTVPSPEPVNTPGVPNPKLPDAEYYSDRGSCEARGFEWTPDPRPSGMNPSAGTCSDPKD